MESVGRRVFSALLNNGVDIHFVPLFLELLFQLWEAGFHRNAEIRIWKVEGVFQVHQRF